MSKKLQLLTIWLPLFLVGALSLGYLATGGPNRTHANAASGASLPKVSSAQSKIPVQTYPQQQTAALVATPAATTPAASAPDTQATSPQLPAPTPKKVNVPQHAQSVFRFLISNL